MSDQPKTDLQALQDYLDGRLSPEQRKAFEARLEHEPSLRLELESALELRSALQGEGPELSQGFYTRARARFEGSGPEARSWSFRLISWETAGVAAAAALVTALFVPRLMQEGVPADLGAVKQASPQATATGEKDVAAKPALPKAKQEEKGFRAEAEANEGIAQEPQAFADKELERQEKSVAPGKQAPAAEPLSKKRDLRAAPEPSLDAAAAGSVADETRRARIDRDDDAFRAAAPMEADSAPPVDRLAEDAAVTRVWAESEESRAERGKRASGRRLVELPAGLVERDRVRTVERIDEWITLLDGPYGDTLGMLGAPAPDRRLVLIGGREGLNCSSLKLDTDEGAYRIIRESLPGEQESAGGCAMVLPRDDRTIVFVEPR